MSSLQMYMLLGALIFLLGLHGLLVLTDPIRRLIAVNLMGAGTFMIMVTLARRTDPADPVLHALVVTGLVVAISATAFALRLITANLITETPNLAENNAAQSDTTLSQQGSPPT